MPKLYRDCCLIVRNNRPVVVICVLGSIIIGFYFFNFNDHLSPDNQHWGTFGDYVGGILNPVIAAFAFYLIAKTYELQKRELEATRSLLEISTNAQKKQIILSAFTALLNSNLTRIDLLKSEKSELLNEVPANVRPQTIDERSSEDMKPLDLGFEKAISQDYFPILEKVRKINGIIKRLTEKNEDLEKRIEKLIKESIE